jgi:hypothetical protein
MSQAYNNDLNTVNSQISSDTATEGQFASEYGQFENQVGNTNLAIPDQDWSDVDATSGGLSTLAQAFMTMSQQGSPVQIAQNNISMINQNAQMAQSAQPGTQTMNAEQQDNGMMQQNQAAQLQKAQMAGQTNAQVLGAKMQQYAIQMQLTHANANAAVAKQNLLMKAKLSAASSLEAQQSLIAGAKNTEFGIQTGESQINFLDWMKGIGVATGAGAQAAAIGTKLFSTNTGDPTLTTGQDDGASNNGGDSNNGGSSYGNNEPNANYTGSDGSVPLVEDDVSGG